MNPRLIGLLAIHSVLVFGGVLRADPKVGLKPTVTVLPTFDCSATPNEKDGTARITHTNAAAVSATQLVVATVNVHGARDDGHLREAALGRARARRRDRRRLHSSHHRSSPARVASSEPAAGTP